MIFRKVFYYSKKIVGKYYLLIMVLCLLFSATEAQNTYAKNTQTTNVKKEIPPFNILLTNETYLSSKDLKKDAQLMLLYFSPECEHCQNFIEKLLERINEFKNTQIVMVSYVPLVQIKNFETRFNLDKYPNIKVGTEGYTFIVQRYYNVTRFPFTALFDKNGLLIASYREAPSINDLLQKIKNK